MHVRLQENTERFLAISRAQYQNFLKILVLVPMFYACALTEIVKSST